MAPRVGIEPTTNWLTANCTTAVLPWNKLVLPEGLEPTTYRVETDRSVQLSYGSILLAPVEGVEPSLSILEIDVLP